MTRSILLCSSSGSFHLKPPYRSRTLPSDRSLSLAIPSYKNGIDFVGNLSTSQGMQRNEMIRRKFAVYNGVQPGVPLPPGPPSSSWNGWILGVAVAIVLPFVTKKCWPLLRLKNQVDAAVETVEHIAEAVEKVAEKVEKVSEDILKDLPAGKLKNAVSFIENVAERTADDAELAGDFIDKVQEVEEKMKSIAESVTEEETELQKKASDGAKEPAMEAKAEQDQK